MIQKWSKSPSRTMNASLGNALRASRFCIGLFHLEEEKRQRLQNRDARCVSKICVQDVIELTSFRPSKVANKSMGKQYE